jgi:hypothetical protein
VWEAENKSSERDIFIPWLTNTSIKDLKSFSFTSYLNVQKQLKETDIFNI